MLFELIVIIVTLLLLHDFSLVLVLENLQLSNESAPVSSGHPVSSYITTHLSHQ
jgi:hypothetical protein